MTASIVIAFGNTLSTDERGVLLLVVMLVLVGIGTMLALKGFAASAKAAEAADSAAQTGQQLASSIATASSTDPSLIAQNNAAANNVAGAIDAVAAALKEMKGNLAPAGVLFGLALICLLGSFVVFGILDLTVTTNTDTSTTNTPTVSGG